jgi:DNA-binding response OmpR family regulator
MTRRLLESILTGADYEVLLAEDGRAAVEMASTLNPDLVITDGLLPKLHGFLVCKAIKEFDVPPKVVILTGVYTKPSYKWEVKKDYGADDILSKPVKPAELIACVKKHIADASPEAFATVVEEAIISSQSEWPVGFAFAEPV